MNANALGSLPAFLTYLGTLPSPQQAFVAMIRGPLARLGVRTGIMWSLVDDQLVAIASMGHTLDEVERYSVLPLGLDLQVTRAVREMKAHYSPIPQFSDSFKAASMDAQLWVDLARRVSGVTIIDTPIIAQGEALGAMGIITDREFPASPAEIELHETVVGAIALWMAHPRTGEAPRITSALNGGPALTVRQAQILRLVETGQSNTQIGRTLGFSESTVKQEVMRAMKAMRAATRLEAAQRARELGLM